MSLPIHPLADLFPLIEGVEFEELVASIKAHGLYEPITLLAGTILDGRNRYRACQKAGVEPRFEDFDGNDPYAFVAAKNISRRHLTAGQRGMIGAEMAKLKLGANQHEGVADFTPSTEQVANLLGITRQTIQDAKVILNEGTSEEIQAAKAGDIGVKAVARQIRERSPDKDRRSGVPQSNVGRHPERLITQQMNAQIWGQLREGLTLLGGLPLPADVVRIARAYDKRTNVINDHLSSALNWLKEFSNEWSNRNGSAEQEEQAASDYVDAGTGERAA